MNGVSFGVNHEGILHHVVEPREGEVIAREQLVLPLEYQIMVIELAQSIPLAGQLGKHKTADRLLQRFYWLTLQKDVADYCRRYAICQKPFPVSAPLISLLIVNEPFQKVEMDNVGPYPEVAR